MAGSPARRAGLTPLRFRAAQLRPTRRRPARRRPRRSRSVSVEIGKAGSARIRSSPGSHRPPLPWPCRAGRCPWDRQDLVGPPLAAAVDWRPGAFHSRRLLPSDATGPLVLNPRTSKFSFQPNPMLANSMLADETNSAPFKTPASLWTRWREAGHRRRDGPPLPRPLPGHGGQDPLDHEGTCPLPQAPLDRPPGVGRLAPAQGRRERTALSHAQGYDPRDLPATGPLPVGCPSS
ncbi:AAA family ATPase [Streptomyces diastaticus]|uniref:AAA family ATPase n=1 Tax=Streptomyces diastaticus TaxID=1956 RepID=UPI0036674890